MSDALHLALLLRPEGPDLDLLTFKLAGEVRDLPVLEVIRQFATPILWNYDPQKGVTSFHSGATIMRVLDGITGVDPRIMLERGQSSGPESASIRWTVERCIDEAAATADRRKRFPMNRPRGPAAEARHG